MNDANEWSAFLPAEPLPDTGPKDFVLGEVWVTYWENHLSPMVWRVGQGGVKDVRSDALAGDTGTGIYIPRDSVFAKHSRLIRDARGAWVPGYCATGPIADAPKDVVAYDVRPGLRFKILSTFLVTAVDGDRVTCVNEESDVVEIESMTVRKLQKELTVGGVTFVGYAPVKDATWNVGQRRRGVIQDLYDNPSTFTATDICPSGIWGIFVEEGPGVGKRLFYSPKWPSELLADAPASCKGAPCGKTRTECAQWNGTPTAEFMADVCWDGSIDIAWCSPECRDRAANAAYRERHPAVDLDVAPPITKAPAPWKCADKDCATPLAPKHGNFQRCVVCQDARLRSDMNQGDEDLASMTPYDRRALAIASLASHLEPGTASALAASGANAWRPRHHGMFYLDPIDEV